MKTERTVLNTAVEDCLRECLRNEGYSLTPKRSHGEKGVDIRASRDGRVLHIEVIGYKRSGPARAKDFYEGFFRALSRLEDGATRCVLALSANAEMGLPARAAQHRTAWIRIGAAFPELEIWLVDTVSKRYTRSTWAKWAQAA